MEGSDVIDNKSRATDALQEALVVVIDAESSVEGPHVRGVLLIHLIHILLVNLRRNRLRSNATIWVLSHAKNGTRRVEHRGLSPIWNRGYRDRGGRSSSSSDSRKPAVAALLVDARATSFS